MLSLFSVLSVSSPQPSYAPSLSTPQQLFQNLYLIHGPDLGATLSEPIQDPSSPKITGSIMLALAESKEEVIQQLKEDIYSTSGVWDWDKVQVHPFKSAFRKNMEGL
ncbi:peroxisomal-coenzyme A synthetase [Physcia stellaris]|nr:peroxisomal-coenzyme A synthetase [Physcia stellaris]